MEVRADVTHILDEVFVWEVIDFRYFIEFCDNIVELD